jgi:hypothetical protein
MHGVAIGVGGSIGRYAYYPSSAPPMYTCTYVCIVVHIRTYVCIVVHIRMYVRAYVYIVVHIRTYICVYSRIYVYVHTYVCIVVHIRMYVRMWFCLVEAKSMFLESSTCQILPPHVV